MKFKKITASDVINDKYYKLQKFLFTDEFNRLSLEAKVLYSILSDRNKLSIKNNWIDKNNDVYIIFTNEEIAKKISCGITKVIRIKKQLVEIGLISEKRQGLTKPNLIYVNNIVSDEEYNLNFQNGNSRISKCETQEFPNVKTSKTDISKTDISNNNNSTTDKNKKSIIKKPIILKTENITIEVEANIQEVKQQIEKTIKSTIAMKAVKALLDKNGIEKVNKYIDNWNKFESSEMKNATGFFVSAVEENYNIPANIKKSNNSNFEQRTLEETKYYDDEMLFENMRQHTTKQLIK